MKIGEKLHQLRHDFKVTLPDGSSVDRFVNSFIYFGDQVVLIDTGVKDSLTNILNYIQLQKRDPKEIASIILTHSHPDHIGSAAALKDITGCKVFANEREASWIENIYLQQSERPVPGFEQLCESGVKIEKILNYDTDFISVIPGLAAGKDEFKLINLPGHSPGLTGFYMPGEKLIFTGDAVLKKGDLPNYHSYKSVKFSILSLAKYPVKKMLSSWDDPKEGFDIEKVIEDSIDYLDEIDKCVKKFYTNSDFIHCQEVIKELGLPAFFANPISHRSFLSHLQ